jgi:hypothetical protein
VYIIAVLLFPVPAACVADLFALRASFIVAHSLDPRQLDSTFPPGAPMLPMRQVAFHFTRGCCILVRTLQAQRGQQNLKALP